MRLKSAVPADARPEVLAGGKRVFAGSSGGEGN
jgi:hypothetical protein